MRNLSFTRKSEEEEETIVSSNMRITVQGEIRTMVGIKEVDMGD